MTDVAQRCGDVREVDAGEGTRSMKAKMYSGQGNHSRRGESVIYEHRGTACPPSTLHKKLGDPTSPKTQPSVQQVNVTQHWATSIGDGSSVGLDDDFKPWSPESV